MRSWAGLDWGFIAFGRSGRFEVRFGLSVGLRWDGGAGCCGAVQDIYRTFALYYEVCVSVKDKIWAKGSWARTKVRRRRMRLARVVRAGSQSARKSTGRVSSVHDNAEKYIGR